MLFGGWLLFSVCLYCFAVLCLLVMFLQLLFPIPVLSLALSEFSQGEAGRDLWGGTKAAPGEGFISTRVRNNPLVPAQA